MKLQLDTVNKTIKLEEKVNLNDLFELLQKILPDIWKEFTLEINSVINWTSPIVIKEYPIYPTTWPNYPWYTQPHITQPYTNEPLISQPYTINCGVTTKYDDNSINNTNLLNNGIYNIDCTIK